MFSTLFNGATVFILNDEWNGKAEFKLAGSLVRDETQSLTKRSARRPYSETILYKCRYQVTLVDDAVRAAIGSLRALNTQPVVIPLWPAMCAWRDRDAQDFSAGLRLVFKRDWSQYALYAATDPEPLWPAPDDVFAPALMGFLKPTQPKMLSPDAALWDIDFTESSPNAYAIKFLAAAFGAGPKPAAYAVAPPLLPLSPDFLNIKEQISVEVKRQQIGFSRQQSSTFYPHDPMRRQAASYTLQDADIWTMLKFFTDVMGPGACFWASTWLQAAKLSLDAGAGDTVLQVKDTNAVNIGDYLSIYCSGDSVSAAKIIAKTANTITIDTAPGVPLNASATLAFQLCLVRLIAPKISMAWNRPGAAKCEIRWEELPPEYVIPADETLGVTLGKLPTRVILIQFTRTLINGTVLNYYFTAYERDIAYAAQNWSSNNGAWEVGDLSQSLNLADDSVTITSFLFPGNPLIADLTKRAEAPLIVIIIFADYDGVTVSNPQTVFTGDCAAPSRDGNKITMKCKMGPSILASPLPIFLRGVQCSHLRGSNNDGTHLISFGCTGPDGLMLKARWQFSALVAAPLSAAFPFTLHLNTLTGVGVNAIASLAANAVFANWFTPSGVISWGAGANTQTRMIVASTAPVAGVLAVTLHRYFNGVPNIGDVITLYPGCDGIYTTCQAYDAALNPTGKFNNYLNFGGEPFTPQTNPSLVGLNRLGTQGAKK